MAVAEVAAAVVAAATIATGKEIAAAVVVAAVAAGVGTARVVEKESGTEIAAAVEGRMRMPFRQLFTTPSF